MTTTTRRTHNATEACRNTDRAHNVQAVEGRGWDPDDDGDQVCADCLARFDDPDHGRFARCSRKTSHLCTIEAS